MKLTKVWELSSFKNRPKLPSRNLDRREETEFDNTSSEDKTFVMPGHLMFVKLLNAIVFFSNPTIQPSIFSRQI